MSAAATADRRGSAHPAARSVPLPPPRLRRRALAVVTLAALLLCGYLFWLRDSSLVKVESVTITGLTTADSARVRAALVAAAREMTTLHVDRGALERATAGFPVVQSIDVRPDFPSGMRIHVIEHRPVALLAAGSQRVPVAADGSVLRGLPVNGRLPLVRVGRLPGERVTGGTALSAVRVAAGVPAALRARVDVVLSDRAKGIVVPIGGGPRIIFGSAVRLTAKWAAAVRVLADADAAGADYIDVRIPARPAAGGLPVATVAPAAPAGESPSPAVPGAGATSAVPGVTGGDPAAAEEAQAPPAPGTGADDAPPGPPGPPQPPQSAAGAGGSPAPNARP